MMRLLTCLLLECWYVGEDICGRNVLTWATRTPKSPWMLAQLRMSPRRQMGQRPVAFCVRSTWITCTSVTTYHPSCHAVAVHAAHYNDYARSIQMGPRMTFTNLHQGQKRQNTAAETALGIGSFAGTALLQCTTRCPSIALNSGMGRFSSLKVHWSHRSTNCSTLATMAIAVLRRIPLPILNAKRFQQSLYCIPMGITSSRSTTATVLGHRSLMCNCYVQASFPTPTQDPQPH